MIVAAEKHCDQSDLPCWLCPHCPEFGQLHAAQKQTQPTPPDRPARIAGWWSLVHLSGGRGYSRRWVSLSSVYADPDQLIDCGPTHPGENPLCTDCATDLGLLLDDTPALLHDLAVAITRDHRFAEHGTYRGGQHDDEDTTTQLPWGDRASTALRELHQMIEAIVVTCKVEVGITTAWTPLTEAIRADLGRIARFDDAPVLAHRYSRTFRAALWAIDRPADTWCYGPCPTCNDTIYQDRVENAEDLVRCGHVDCPYTATLEAHQAHVLNRAADKLLTVAELVSAISWAGLTVTRDQVNGWIRRGRLTRHTVNRARWENGALVSDTQDTYTLGAALQLATEANQRKKATS